MTAHPAERTRLLIITPVVPYLSAAACDQDRYHGALLMKRAGYDVHMFAAIHPYQSETDARAAYAKEGITLTLVPGLTDPYRFAKSAISRLWKDPALWDGSALGCMHPSFEQGVHSVMKDFRPQVVWIDYTHQWPLLRLLKPYGVPLIIKSSINEPANCRAEHGWSLSSIIKSIPKYLGEKRAARESDYLFAITPEEENFYRSLGGRNTGVMPLRALPQCFVRKKHQDKLVINVIYLSSNYNIRHNKNGADFILRRIVPLIRSRAPGTFRFHFTGKKIPAEYESLRSDDVVFTGHVPDLAELLATMDVAVCPWISGHGMQQKVFEPLCRSLPLVTNKTAGYPFVDGKEILMAHTPEQYVEKLLELRDAGRRQELADAAYEKAWSLFSEEALQRRVADVMQTLLA